MSVVMMSINVAEAGEPEVFDLCAVRDDGKVFDRHEWCCDDANMEWFDEAFYEVERGLANVLDWDDDFAWRPRPIFKPAWLPIRDWCGAVAKARELDGDWAAGEVQELLFDAVSDEATRRHVDNCPFASVGEWWHSMPGCFDVSLRDGQAFPDVELEDERWVELS